MSTSSQSQPVHANIVSMPTDKNARDALRKVREAIERVAPGVLPKSSSDIDKETAAVVKVIEGLQPKPSGKPQLPDVQSRPFNAVDCPVCGGGGKVDSRLPGRKKDCPRCLGRGWVRPTR